MKPWLILIALFFVNAAFAENSEEIGSARYVTGGLLSIYPGFGIGHAVQGRYLDKGWIFTAGEVAFGTVVVIGLDECAITSALSRKTCPENDTIAVGMIGFLGFKIWEIIDAWVKPHKKNVSTDNSHELKKETFETMIMPTSKGGLLALRYSF